jgi:hypothetical protein
MSNITFRENGLPHRVYSLGQTEFEKLTNSEVSELMGIENQRHVWNARNTVSLKTGWKLGDDSGERKPRQAGDKPARKAGSLPMVFEGFLLGQDIEELSPESILDFVKMDTPAWNRFIRRMENADEVHVRSFEKWLGHGATMSRQADFLANARKNEMEGKMEKILSIIGEDVELADLLLKTLAG